MYQKIAGFYLLETVLALLLLSMGGVMIIATAVWSVSNSYQLYWQPVTINQLTVYSVAVIGKN